MEWVLKAKRLPTEKELDAQKCVLVWHDYSGCMVMNLDNMRDNGFIKYWMKLPERPVQTK